MRTTLPLRTTLTLDADVAAKLKAEARRTGKPFKAIVNDALRLGLSTKAAPAEEPFQVRTRDLGGLQPGITSLDNVEEVLDQIEGPWRR